MLRVQVGMGERMVELGVGEAALVVRPRERRERQAISSELEQARPHPRTISQPPHIRFAEWHGSSG